MRLVMTLLVRDEADIVRENLDFHFAQGIDFAIVMDNGSTDGTAEILEEYAARGLIRLIHRPGAFDPEPWVNELVGIAIREEGADWVLPNDADEFWLPRAGTLKELLATLPDEIGAVVAQRHNFLPAPEGPEPWWERMTRRARVSLNAHGRPLPPKIVHRTHPGLRIRRGNHRRMPPREGRVLRTDAVEVLHFQMRSYAQFERRVIQIGSALVGRDDLPERVGRARKLQYELWKEGRLREAYEAAALESDAVEDTRLRDALLVLRSMPAPIPGSDRGPDATPLAGAGL
jgi:hypothetical protein